MKKKELSEFLSEVITEVLKEYALDHQKLYKPKRRHIDKYRNSKYHPDELAKQTRINAIQQKKSGESDTREPSFSIAPNVRVFLNTTLEAIPPSAASTKILHGIQVGKQEAMALSRTLLNLPGFPFQQPRKLMNLLLLLAIENRNNQ